MANVIFRFENGDPVMVSTMVGENLLETARKSNVVIDAPCSGNGSCGKCRVKLEGSWNPGRPAISATRSTRKAGAWPAAARWRAMWRFWCRISRRPTGAA